MAVDGGPRSGSGATQEAVSALTPPGQCYLLASLQAQGYSIYLCAEQGGSVPPQVLPR